MPNDGPIIIIEDDEDDRVFIASAIKQCGLENELKFFDNGKPALEYLYATTDRPFLIFCDINMPVMNGLELRRRINDDVFLRRKSIPFVFLTTTDNRQHVEEAYDLTIQGFFKKPNNLEELRHVTQEIVGYWLKCLHPNT